MLSLNLIQSEKIPFELGEDQTIYFKVENDFDLHELAAWRRILKTLNNVSKQRKTAKNEDAYAKAEKKNKTACLEMIHLVLPDFPSETLENLQDGQIDKLAGLCITVANGSYSRQRLDPETAVEIQEQYPDLPDEFINTLSRKQAGYLIELTEEKAKNV